MNFANIYNTFKSAKKELYKVSALVGSAMLIALDLLLNSFRIVVSNLLEISFSFVALAVCAMQYGPILGMLVGAITDVLGHFLRSSGAFFPGFTINAILSGLIYGCFFYQKEVTWKRVILCRLLIMVLINLILTPIWLHMMYGSALLTSIRIIKNIILFPIDSILLYFILKTVQKVRP